MYSKNTSRVATQDEALVGVLGGLGIEVVRSDCSTCGHSGYIFSARIVRNGVCLCAAQVRFNKAMTQGEDLLPGVIDARVEESGVPTTPSPVSPVPVRWTSCMAEQDWRVTTSTTGVPRAEAMSIKGVCAVVDVGV
jgi:hypothetical protein